MRGGAEHYSRNVSYAFVPLVMFVDRRSGGRRALIWSIAVVVLHTYRIFIALSYVFSRQFEYKTPLTEDSTNACIPVVVSASWVSDG